MTVAAVAVAVILLVTTFPARAHDAARPDLNDWYLSLHSGRGPCCGGPKEDATQLDELQWERDAQGYRVFVRGEWVRVPDEAVVPVPNREGRALVWYGFVDGHPVVRCFLPGDLT